ncbi:Uncharacterised protein [Mycobacteroides abscessus subsp. abscessus]|nr:Uncharacterised protein [Mycobacteroides abscessus subsp. abscessus]
MAYEHSGLAIVGIPLDHRTGRSFDPIPRSGRYIDENLDNVLDDPFGGIAVNIDEYLLLVFEMVVDGTLTHLGRLGDVVHRGVIESALDEQHSGGLDDGRACQRGIPLAATRLGFAHRPRYYSLNTIL